MSLDVSVGTTTSESYASVAEADAYHVKFGNTAWAALTNTAKEIALRNAALFIDTYSFIGSKTYSLNALEWPRYTSLTNGYIDQGIPSNAIPDKVKWAQCEAALRESSGSMLADKKDGYVTEETVGPITKRYSDYSKKGDIKYPKVDAYLREYLASSGSYHRVNRT